MSFFLQREYSQISFFVFLRRNPLGQDVKWYRILRILTRVTKILCSHIKWSLWHFWHLKLCKTFLWILQIVFPNILLNCQHWNIFVWILKTHYAFELHLFSGNSANTHFQRDDTCHIIFNIKFTLKLYQILCTARKKPIIMLCKP